MSNPPDKAPSPSQARPRNRVVAWSLFLVFTAISACRPGTHHDSASGHGSASPDASRTTPQKPESRLRYRIERTQTFTGCCDGSGGVDLNRDLFVTVNDEDSILRVFSREAGGPPIQKYNARRFLGLKKHEEADLEAAARIDHRVYFIASHARNMAGKKRKARRRFFALDFRVQGDRVAFHPFGKPYSKLLADLERAPELQELHLADAAKSKSNGKKALNIEALASTPDGALLIGFRSPIVEGRSLVLPLLNPDAVLTGRERARFDSPIRLKTGHLGIRGMARYRHEYILIGAPTHSGKSGTILKWDGQSETPITLSYPGDLDCNAESVITYPDLGLARLQLLLDEGNTRISGKTCKDHKPSRQRFRALWLRHRVTSKSFYK